MFCCFNFLIKKRRKSPPYLLRNRARYYNNYSCLTGKPCRILVFFYPNYLNGLSNRLYLKITEMPSFWDQIKPFFLQTKYVNIGVGDLKCGVAPYTWFYQYSLYTSVVGYLCWVNPLYQMLNVVQFLIIHWQRINISLKLYLYPKN